MANCENGSSPSSMGNVLNVLNNVFKIQDIPATPLPPPLLMFGAKLRTGLSARKIASRIISRQSEAGAPAGDIFSEDNNISEAMETIRVEEMINAILTEGKVEVTVPPGIPVQTLGVGYMGVPVVSMGLSNGIASGDGVIR